MSALTPALVGGPLLLGVVLGAIVYAGFHPAEMLFPPANGAQCMDAYDCYQCNSVGNGGVVWTIPPASNCGTP